MPLNERWCGKCSNLLEEPYILCSQCNNACICLQCFARGVEFGTHCSDHSYEIVRNNFTLFTTHWTAGEETKLLQLINEFGCGNWTEIAKQIRTKNKDECESHYNSVYINNPQGILPVFKNELQDSKINESVKLITYEANEDLCRYTIDSPQSYDLAGYISPRAEFEIEYDNFAESMLQDVAEPEENDADISREYKYAMLSIYNFRLQQRQLRKRFVKEYGLLNIKKQQVIDRRADRTIRNLREQFVTFARFLSPEDYEKRIQLILFESQLLQRINKLKEYRINGITSIRGCNIYEQLKRKREDERMRHHHLEDTLSALKNFSYYQRYIHRQFTAGNEPYKPIVPMRRKPAPRLDISGAPELEKLDDDEKELCSQLRLLPKAYIEYRDILLAEHQKQGSLKLAQARVLIRIDVNKTRKLYDFLCEKSLISANPLDGNGV
ncbi:Transcriptional adapter 2-alpha [Trichoplax sp. H2]|nr:Transcriptional adapter 2-alpha [Trichoplax sp. H2]|eukprot:RDD38062.1 Transcriptional adapter 2-alpha [Trichoplax sp. H2]